MHFLSLRNRHYKSHTQETALRQTVWRRRTTCKYRECNWKRNRNFMKVMKHITIPSVYSIDWALQTTRFDCFSLQIKKYTKITAVQVKVEKQVRFTGWIEIKLTTDTKVLDTISLESHKSHVTHGRSKSWSQVTKVAKVAKLWRIQTYIKSRSPRYASQRPQDLRRNRPVFEIKDFQFSRPYINIEVSCSFGDRWVILFLCEVISNAPFLFCSACNEVIDDGKTLVETVFE